jgi:hypothetical protein
VGLDLGLRRDYSAIAVLEFTEEVDGTRDPVTMDFRRERVIRLRHVERVRLGTPYNAVVEHVGKLVHDPRLQGCTLVADATGVGAPVVELLRAARLPCRLIAAQITGGSGESSDGEYHRVPKRDLVVGLQVLFEQWRFEVADTPAAAELMRELAGMKGKRSPGGGMQHSGPRDDLAIALALAWWWMRKRVAWQTPQGRVV